MCQIQKSHFGHSSDCDNCGRLNLVNDVTSIDCVVRDIDNI